VSFSETKPYNFNSSDLEVLADLLTERILDRLKGACNGEVPVPSFISPAELAGRLGKSRAWVYEHSADLGAIRLGDGSRPRLAFRLDEVEERLQRIGSRGVRVPEDDPVRSPSPRAAPVAAEALLPIGPKSRRSG
jgi:hypothetical protein